MIANRTTDGGLQRLAQLILDAAGRGASVTRRLLAFSRHGDLRAEPIAPAELLHGLTEVLEPALGPSVRMQIKAPPGLPAVIADKGQLETALINLATNARDAMPSGGVPVLSAVTETVPDRPNAFSLRPGRYVRFTVTDTGVGMDAATLARVTEPFFTTKPAGEGQVWDSRWSRASPRIGRCLPHRKQPGRRHAGQSLAATGRKRRGAPGWRTRTRTAPACPRAVRGR